MTEVTSQDVLTSSQEDKLCDRCKILDLTTAFEDRSIIHERDGRKLISTGIPDDAGDSDCPMCRLLHRTRYNGPGKLANKKNRHRRYTLWAASYLRASEVQWNADASTYEHIDVVCVLVIPEGFTLSQVFTAEGLWNSHPSPECILGCLNPDDHMRTVSEQSITQPKASSTYHGAKVGEHVDLESMGVCFREEDKQFPQKFDRDTEVKNLLLINCETRSISRPESKQTYVTLSYVWGKAAPADLKDWIPRDGLPLPGRLPRAIEDAIETTVALGYTWLWVDQICIDQASAAHRATQIASMDKIYGASVVTLIAAAGNNANYGLPGAPSRPRKVHQKYAMVKLSELVLLPGLARPEWVISKSVWATRGWTYQEGFLARRCLVFTDEQVYLEVTKESGGRRLEIESVRDYSRGWAAGNILPGFRSGYFWGGCCGKPSYVARHVDDLQDNHIGLSDHLKAYLRRQLTHDSDLLSAFVGIINHFNKTACWGLPLDLRMIQYKHAKGQYGEKSLRRCLHDEFVCILGWRYSDIMKTRRRTGFPSFSWTGWTGCARLESGHLLSVIWPTVHPKLKIKSPDMRSLGEIESAMLLLEAEIVKIEVTRLSQRAWAPINDPVTQDISVTVFRLELPEILEDNEQLECIRVAEDNYTDPKNYHLRCGILLVIRRFAEYVERRGLLRVQERYHDWVQGLPHVVETLTLQ